MKFKASVQQFGNADGTMFVNIPKPIREQIGLEKGQEVQVSIVPIVVKNITTYKCNNCLHEFSMDDDLSYCPSCESEDLFVQETEND